jgi:thiamine kinase-like enzyme
MAGGPVPPLRVTPDVETLLQGLRVALRAGRLEVGSAELEILNDKGLAHHHLRLLGTGLLARLPKQSQMGLPAFENLAYEAACFQRTAASGHVPRLLVTLAPSPVLPRGGLLVEEVLGRPARLPQDLSAIATALAAVHALPLPAPAERAPLQDAADPLEALRQEIDAQALYLDSAGLEPAARAHIERVRQQFHHRCNQAARPVRRLIVFDAHPGNFLLRDDGRAVLVDLEKARYSYPPLDLAHATLYTSTTWDVESYAELSPEQVADTYLAWESACDLGASQRAWLLPLRGAMWLWAVTWCAKWRVLSPRQSASTPEGEDWSQALTAQALVEHVRGRVDCYLSHAAIERVVDEMATLERLLPA